MGNIITAYVTDRALPQVTAEDACRLTHINIAFGLVMDDKVIFDHLQNTEHVDVIRKYNPKIKMLLSVGGWGAGGFSEAACSEPGRKSFAATAAQAVKELGLDGIDIDWEYPCIGVANIASSPDDRKNFTLLLRELRVALDSCEGTRKLLTIAAGADQYFVDGTQMDEAQQYLDIVQLMTYDMRGGFQILTGHHTNLYESTGDLFRISVENSVNSFVKAGVPREKIVVGAAFYSRKWTQVPSKNNGLFQMTPGAGGYGVHYTELTQNYINKNGFVRYWDSEACAPWLFNGDTFFSYDDEQSICCKCDFVKAQGLAGIMYWEHSGDATGMLLKTMCNKLNQ
jgi:chitinase